MHSRKINVRGSKEYGISRMNEMSNLGSKSLSTNLSINKSAMSFKTRKTGSLDRSAFNTGSEWKVNFGLDAFYTKVDGMKLFKRVKNLHNSSRTPTAPIIEDDIPNILIFFWIENRNSSNMSPRGFKTLILRVTLGSSCLIARGWDFKSLLSWL